MPSEMTVSLTPNCEREALENYLDAQHLVLSVRRSSVTMPIIAPGTCARHVALNARGAGIDGFGASAGEPRDTPRLVAGDSRSSRP